MWYHLIDSSLVDLMQSVLGWLFTYILHSSLLIASAMILTSQIRSERAKDNIWKAALLGGIITATLQIVFDFGLLTLRWQAAPEATNLLPPAAAALAERSRAVFETGDTLHIPTLFFQIWLLGIVIGLMRQLILRWQLWRMFRHRKSADSPALTQLLTNLTPQPIRLTSSPFITSPVALNRREICVPIRVLKEMPAAQQAALLAHETAHLVRRDPLWLTIFSWLETIFFFQPLLTIGRRRWQVSAELLCDQYALEQTNDPVSLAQCLATVARWVKQPPPSTLAALASSPLRRRVERALHTDVAALRAAEAHTARWVLLCLGLLLAILSIAPTTAVSTSVPPEPQAQPLQPTPTTTAPSSTVSNEAEVADEQPATVIVPPQNDSAWQSGAEPARLIEDESSSLLENSLRPTPVVELERRDSDR